METKLESENQLISERSCDTEKWSNGCWKFSFVNTGIHYIL